MSSVEVNWACSSARHCSRHCPRGAAIPTGKIRKTLAWGINANEWSLGQLILTPPFSTRLLDLSQLLLSLQKVAGLESCLAASLFLSWSLCSFLLFLLWLSVLTVHDLKKFASNCAKHRVSQEGGWEWGWRSLGRQVSQSCLNQNTRLYWICLLPSA